MTAPFVTPPELTAIFLAGLAGSVHCIGMCGPYIVLCQTTRGLGKRPGAGTFALFSAARVSVYIGLGAAAGWAGGTVSHVAITAAAWVSVVAGIVSLVFALSLLQLIPDPALFLSRLGWNELVKEGIAGALRLNSPFSRVPAAIKKTVVVLILGGIQGLLPCGLVYAFVARAGAAGSAVAGSAVMLAFGSGTVPMVTALVFFSARLGEAMRERLFRISGALVVMGAAALILRGFARLGWIPHGLVW